ncbi:MAG: sodium:calcium antiporter [Haloarculaceae archaeon]
MSRLRHPLTAVAVALVLTVPWVITKLTGVAATFGAGLQVLVTGLAVLGASFMLAWAAETAEEDVPRAFALAVLAVLAVAPEYAVDALYAWGAGSGGATAQACADLAPEVIQRAAEGQGKPLAEACHDANLAIANMTGANRILIGIGWAGIAAFTILRARRHGDSSVEHRDGFLADVIHLDRGIATEISFLAAATLWAFLVPFGGGIDVIDTVVLVGLYVTYIGIIIKAGAEAQEEHVGVPAYFQEYSFPRRVTVVVLLFGYSALMIFTAVEPFAHGLEDIGLAIGVPEFFMIQWFAPLASESPELIVVAVLVMKARSTAGFNTLVSSKLNQWTLLIGTLAIVYSIALGSVGTLPFDYKQSLEIWITAAQSFLAIAILVNFRISMREATALFVLFITQVIAEFVVLKLLSLPNPEAVTHNILLGYTVVYLVLGAALFVSRREAVKELLGLTRATARAAMGRGPKPDHAD